MDNVVLKRLPSNVLPTVTGDNVIICETKDGDLYWCDSDGAKMLTTNKNKYRVGDIVIRGDGISPAEEDGGTWEQFSGEYYLKCAQENYGVQEEEGLPNIAGSLIVRSFNDGGTYLFLSGGAALSVNVPTRWEGSHSPTAIDSVGAVAYQQVVTLSAQNANPIYGRSNSVTPKNIAVAVWQKIA